jgi:hypothetical protein
MRIIVCTKRDLIGCTLLNEVLPQLSGHHVTVLLSDKTRNAETTVPELGELKYLERDLPIGTLFPMIDRLVETGGDPDWSRPALATFASVPERFGVAVRVMDSITRPETVDLVRSLAPDIIISIRFSHIFRRSVFDIPRFGTFNVHPGELPRYAGLFPSMRTMADGDAKLGCTLHRVDDGIDTGPVVGIGFEDVHPGRSLLWHIPRTYRPGIALFMEMLKTLERGETVTETVQDPSGRIYASMPDAAAFADFKAKGFRLYDPGEYRDMLAGFLPPALSLAR